jgi:heme-degrading monooxygenase HmoA
MHARMGRITFSPDKADDVTSHVQENVVPRYDDADGFKGFTLLLDRSAGQGVGISFWESEDAMRASDDIGDQARQGAVTIDTMA